MTQLNKYTIYLLILWLSAGILSLTWNIYDDHRQQKNLALQTAQTFLSQLQDNRVWSCAHDRAYVPVTETHHQNPLLSGHHDLDLRTTAGLQQTWIDSTSMIGELCVVAALNKSVTFHISSLSPVRPENHPYAWEEPWLQKFQTDRREIHSVVNVEGKPKFRFMAPLIVQRECLGCHVEKKYSIGDIRGGVSITLPMEKTGLNWPLLLSHLGPMMAGTLLILFFNAKLRAGRAELLSLNQTLTNEIQDRKEAQSKLQATSDQLEDSTERLKKSNRALEDFTHIISHDLQEPLILIQAFSQRLRDRGDNLVDHQSNRYIEHIYTAAERMRELISGLLLYARTSSKTEPFVPVDLSIIVDEVLDTLALQIEKSKSTIIKDRLPVITGDPLLIRQLFQNIISNSLKYRNKDIQNTIHIRYRGTVQHNNGSNQVQISICDNGIGFAPEAGHHIFDIFERLQSEQEVKGTGIGLAICKKIVARHGGKILASGQPNQGAEFTFWLPKA